MVFELKIEYCPTVPTNTLENFMQSYKEFSF